MCCADCAAADSTRLDSARGGWLVGLLGILLLIVIIFCFILFYFIFYFYFYFYLQGFLFFVGE